LRQRLATPRADAVVDQLADARLIAVSDTEGEAHVAVIHEALIDAWPRLQTWVREDVEGARMRDEIRAAAHHWHGRGRPRGLLWRDDSLAELERWLRRPGGAALSDLEAAFIEASRRVARRSSRTRGALWLVAVAVAFAFGAFSYVQHSTREQL